MTRDLVFDDVVVRIGDEVVFEADRRVPAGTVVRVTGTEASTVSTVLEAVVRSLTDAGAAGTRTPGDDGPLRPDGGVRLDGSVRLVGDPRSDGSAPGDGTAPLVATAPREHGLVGALTATENVLLGVLARRRPTAEDHRAVDVVLEALAVPPAVRGNLAEQLSGGQQQRVAVARALVAGAPVVALDDPVSELDERTRSVVLDAVLALAGDAVVLLGLPDDGVLRDDTTRDDRIVVIGTGGARRRPGRHAGPSDPADGATTGDSARHAGTGAPP